MIGGFVEQILRGRVGHFVLGAEKEHPNLPHRTVVCAVHVHVLLGNHSHEEHDDEHRVLHHVLLPVADDAVVGGRAETKLSELYYLS
jgi:hypothetical protein